MFMSNTDSKIFQTREDLEADGWHLERNIFISSNDTMLPLYEAKLIHQFDHRLASYDKRPEGSRDTELPRLDINEKNDPWRSPIPRYWVQRAEVDKRLDRREWDKDWLFGWRDITNATNERTMICSVLPRTATPDGTLLMLPTHRNPELLLANLNSFAFDFAVRQKISGTHLKFFTVKQLPVLLPSAFDLSSEFIRMRVLELTYNAWDIEPFARDLGHDGPPFRWDEERRFVIRAELDAAFFHLYGIDRDDVDYIMETFPIVKRKDEQRCGTFRTKDLILEIYDAMAEALQTGEPYQTILDPPPGQGPRHG
jgi:hypothetical protein